MIVWAVTVWVVLAGFYLFLAGDVSAPETVACVVCASAGTVLAMGIARVRHRHFAGMPPARAVWRPLVAILPETLIVGRQLVAAIVSKVDQRGAFVRQPFEPDANDDPMAAGRRAAAVLGVSLAPRTFVVRGEASDTMLLHALPAKPASPDRRWPT